MVAPILMQALATGAYRPRPLMGQLGDSRLANGSSGGGTLRYMHGVGSWVPILTKGKVSAPLRYSKAASNSTLTSYVGDGGQNARGIIPADGSSGQLDDLLAMNPLSSHALLLTGTNEIASGMSLAAMKTAILTVWTRLLAYGVAPIVILDTPRSWSVAAQRQQHFAWNTWLMINGPKYGAVIIDATSDLQDFANANGDPLAALYYDSSPAIHPGNLGCYLIGLRVAAYFNSLPTANPYRGFSRGDGYAAGNPGGNLMPNGGVGSGSGGSKSGTNVSGSVVDGMQVVLTTGAVTSCVCSIEARADGGPGNWQVLTVTTSGAATLWYYPASDITVAGGNIAVGDVLEFGFDFDATAPANVSGVSGRLDDYNVSTLLASQYGMVFDATKGAIPTAFAGRAEADALTLLANTTRVIPLVSLNIGGAVTGAVLKVGGLSLRKPQA